MPNDKPALSRRLSFAVGTFQQKTFASTATSLLKEQILSGQFQPGERLNELAISEQLRISRSPIREALQSLAGQGLVRIVPGRGSYVMDFDVNTIRELGEVRIALETHAARLAARHATHEQLEQMEGMLDVAETAVKAGSSYPSDRDFHSAVLVASQNGQILAYAEEVNARLLLARARSGRIPARAAEAFEEHGVILDALQDRDGDAAAQAMDRHLRKAVNSIIELVTDRASVQTTGRRNKSSVSPKPIIERS